MRSRNPSRIVTVQVLVAGRVDSRRAAASCGVVVGGGDARAGSSEFGAVPCRKPWVPAEEPFTASRRLTPCLVAVER